LSYGNALIVVSISALFDEPIKVFPFDTIIPPTYTKSDKIASTYPFTYSLDANLEFFRYVFCT
jgi:hypothetical protein